MLDIEANSRSLSGQPVSPTSNFSQNNPACGALTSDGRMIAGRAAMKNLLSQIFAFVLLLVSGLSFAQFEDVDARVAAYPKSFSDAQPLADRINADFSTDIEKARAIFTWTAKNITYDMHALYSQANGGVAFSYSTTEEKLAKEREFRLKLVKKTLRSGKAICEGYTSLFTYLCALTGVDAVIIPGTSKTDYTQIGKLPTASDHTWNAIKIDGKWRLVDVTWAAGVVKAGERKFTPYFNDAYFCTDPRLFALNHYPDDPHWLLTDLSPEEFAEMPFYYPTYLQSDYRLNADKGAIIFPKNTAVRFNIQNLRPGDRVAYITSRDNYLDELDVDENSNFIIPPGAKLSGYLTIFVNEKPIVSYKILRG
jgi:transglutaminase/protease-like cytokinesis protein 3